MDIEDEEFERLLEQLNASLIFDRRSIWQIAGRTPPKSEDEDDEALRLDYLDVDYEMLRQHPKVQQYIQRKSGGASYTGSRLQKLLNAITSHFQGLLDLSTATQATAAVVAQLEESAAETEEEREQEEEKKQRRRRTLAKRRSRLLKNFIRRYLRGIRSKDFQELAGFEVVGQNYVIFGHVLWRIFFNEWVDADFLVDAFLQTWTFFWGTEEKEGYFRTLGEESQAQVLQWIQEHHADARFIAALYHCAYLTRKEGWDELRFALRDFWRDTLADLPFNITAGILEDAWRIVAQLIPYNTPSPVAIVEELAALASFETRKSLLQKVMQRFELTSDTCYFGRRTVYREFLGREDTVECLVVGNEQPLADRDTAVSVLRTWMRGEEREYYRIQARESKQVLFYEVTTEEGIYWTGEGSEVELRAIYPDPVAWERPLAMLETRAAEAAERIYRVGEKDALRAA